jgi:Na+-driven multidrug efflux pump
MRKIQRSVMIAAAGISLLTMLFLLTCGKYLIPFFIQDGDIALYDLSLRAMLLYSISYLVSWIPVTLSSYMTAVERPRNSIDIALLATLVFPLIFLAILVPLLGLDGVWLLYFVSGVFSAITSIIIVKRAKIRNNPGRLKKEIE